MILFQKRKIKNQKDLLEFEERKRYQKRLFLYCFLALAILIILLEGFLVWKRSRPAPTNELGQVVVTITDRGFSPSKFVLKRGGSVLWLNSDNESHNISDGGQLDSGEIRAGERFTYTFEGKGEVDYHCKFKPEMKGEIIIK